MKRLTSLVVLGTAALLISSPLYAQRGMSGRGGGGGSFHAGGGFRSGPSPGGFRSAGPMGFRTAPGGFRSGPGFSTFGPRTPGLSSFAPGARTVTSHTVVSGSIEPSFVNRPFGFNHFHHHHSFAFFNGCFGCSPFFFGGGFFLGAPFYSGFYGPAITATMVTTAMPLRRRSLSS